MTRIDDKNLQTARVTIWGQEYVLSSSEPVSYTQEISAYVDRKMKNIAIEKNMSDTAKIAIMVALDIADTLLTHRAQQEDNQSRTKDALQRLEQLLDGIPKDEEAA